MISFKILIADDDKSVHEDIKNQLDGIHVVHSAFDLNQERGQLNEHNFDIIFQDIKMNESIDDKLEIPTAGFEIIKEYRESGKILTNNPIVYYMTQERVYLKNTAKLLNLDLSRFKHKGLTEDFWSGFVREVLAEALNEDSKSRAIAYEIHPEIINAIEGELEFNVELQKKIIEFINTIKDDSYLNIDLFINGFRRAYRLTINKLIEKYPPKPAHLRYGNLIRYNYLKAIFSSSVASLYAGLIQATNGAEHRESRNSLMNDFGILFEDDNNTHTDQDKFINYYDKEMFSILCNILFSFMNMSKVLILDENKQNNWNR